MWPRTARYRETISAIPPYCALWGFWCLKMANWVRYPLPLLWAFPPCRACEVEVRYPPSKGVSQRYLREKPHENKANGCDTPLCDTISKGYCAIWGVSRIGLPSQRHDVVHKLLQPTKLHNSPHSILFWRYSAMSNGVLQVTPEILHEGSHSESKISFNFRILRDS